MRKSNVLLLPLLLAGCTSEDRSEENLNNALRECSRAEQVLEFERSGFENQGLEERAELCLLGAAYRLSALEEGQIAQGALKKCEPQLTALLNSEGTRAPGTVRFIQTAFLMEIRFSQMVSAAHRKQCYRIFED